MIKKIKTSLSTALLLSVLILNSSAQTGMNNKKLQVSASSVEIIDFYNESLNAMEIGDTKRAIELLNQTFTIDSTFFLGNFQMVLYDLYYGDTELLMKHTRQALNHKTILSEGEQVLKEGLLLFRRNNSLSHLSEAAKRLTNMYPKDKEVWYLLGSIQILNHEYTEAMNSYKKLLSKSNNPAAAYNRMGYIHMFIGDFDAAEQAFNRYIELNPHHPNPWDSKGDYFMRMKEYEQAFGCYMKAHSLNKSWGIKKATKAKWKSLSGRY